MIHLTLPLELFQGLQVGDVVLGVDGEQWTREQVDKAEVEIDVDAEGVFEILGIKARFCKVSGFSVVLSRSCLRARSS